MPYRGIATVYYEHHKKHTLCGKVQKFLMMQQVVFKILKILIRNPEGVAE
jgi:histidinol phosphatase-like enzyme